MEKTLYDYISEIVGNSNPTQITIAGVIQEVIYKLQAKGIIEIK